MDLIGSKVKHNKFGEGIVTEQGDSYIFVKFVTEVSLKKFLYPSCFETFLKLLDATAETDETVKQQRMMLEQRGKTQYVDFDHPEFCTGTNPVSCIVEGKSFNGVNWRDILVALTEDFLQNKPAATALYRTSVYPMGAHAFLLKEKPKFSARQILNGYWINVNLSIKDLVFTIGKLCRFCGVDLNDVNITYIPKQNTEGIRR